MEQIGREKSTETRSSGKESTDENFTDQNFVDEELVENTPFKPYGVSLLRDIGIYLPYGAFEELCLVNPDFLEEMRKENFNKYFWISKVENTLGIIVPEDMFDRDDWKKIYKTVATVSYIEDLLLSCELHIVRLALLAGADPSGSVAITTASENGCTSVVELFLQDPRVDPSVENNYAIQLACQEGYISTVIALLKDPRVDPSVENNAALSLAIENDYIDIVELLLDDPRIDPTIENNYAIELASYNRHFDMVELLLEDKRIRSSLHPDDLGRYMRQIR